MSQHTVTSADGTSIAFDRAGTGPAVILIQSAGMTRTHPTLSGIATTLSPWFTVINYDRRGRGDSGDTQPYAVRKEIEDLTALIAYAGGTASVFGGSSGAALALRAAAGNPAIGRLALWEPPYHVDDSAPTLPVDFADQLEGLIGAGRPGEAVERFLVEAAELPRAALAEMRHGPMWAEMEATAHTLGYEARVMGPANRLPADLVATVTQPALVLNGACSPAWMRSAGLAVTRHLAGSVHRVLDGQAHNVSVEAIAPELLEFFVTR